MNFVRVHWFGLLIGLWLFLLTGLVIVVLIAPHQDAKGRGFAYCTQNFIEELGDCENASLCTPKAVWHNTLCDIDIISKSFTDWLANKHPYPWSGYIFEPEIKQWQSDYFDEEEIKEYMDEYPDTAQEMERLKQLRKELENAQNENFSDEQIIKGPTSGMGFE